MDRVDLFADARVQNAFQEFPLPLAVLDREGHIQTLNRRFAEDYGPRCLGSAAVRGMVHAPPPAWEPVSLTARDGAAVSARAHCLPIEDHLVLVLDDAPHGVATGELKLLHERIKELERESTTDRLTGAWNRLHLDRVLAAEMDRSTRFKEPLSIVIIDIDHFKGVNDTHGHLAGDAVLKHLVTLVNARLRAADLLVRWGGEEFVVLISAGYRGAESAAEGVRRAVEAATFPEVGTVTISLGVAELLPSEAPEAWFARADAMLYAAKNGGRNRVSVDRRGCSDAWAAEHGRSALHLVWKEAYESGDATIDREHEELFELANALIDASVDVKPGSGAAPAAMDSLIAHLTQHFSDEETLLEERGYARLALHKDAHARLLQRALRLRQEMQAGTTKLGAIVEFLAGQVVAKHLLSMDRDFFPLFRR